MPTGVIGPESPVSMITEMARALMPTTFSFLYSSAQGMRSSNHCACWASLAIASVLAGLRKLTTASHAPFCPRASR
jgi:hypothetical protein